MKIDFDKKSDKRVSFIKTVNHVLGCYYFKRDILVY